MFPFTEHTKWSKSAWARTLRWLLQPSGFFCLSGFNISPAIVPLTADTQFDLPIISLLWHQWRHFRHWSFLPSPSLCSDRFLLNHLHNNEYQNRRRLEKTVKTSISTNHRQRRVAYFFSSELRFLCKNVISKELISSPTRRKLKINTKLLHFLFGTLSNLPYSMFCCLNFKKTRGDISSHTDIIPMRHYYYCVIWRWFNMMSFAKR